MCSTFPSDARVFREQQVSTVLSKTQEPSKIICMAHRLVILSDDCNLHQLCIPPFSSHFLSYLVLLIWWWLIFFLVLDTNEKKASLGRFIPLWGVYKNIKICIYHFTSKSNSGEYIPWFNFFGVPFHFLLIAPSCKVVWSNTSLCQRLDQFFCLSYHNYYLATVCSFLLLSKFPLVSEGLWFPLFHVYLI